MHFTTFVATSAAVAGALAGVYYEEPAYLTTSEKVYTSVKTCTETPYGAPTSEAVYTPTSEAVYATPSGYGPASEVTYTSYEKITVTSCGDYVTNCPAATYTSTAYSVSTCTGAGPYYTPPANTTEYYVPPAEYPTETPVYYAPTSTPVYEAPETYTHTYYTTVCPGKDYCYATTVTSTYCPGASTHYTVATEVPSYTPVPPPAYTTSVTYYPPTPPTNETTPVYTPPPSYTGAASSNAVSFGVAAIAGLAALFIAA